MTLIILEPASMSNMLKNVVSLDKSYDIYLTMAWGEGNHGISGHIYEVIEYYFILSGNGIKTGILLCEDIDWPMFKRCITTKYTCTDVEILNIYRDTTFHNRPTCVRGKNILFVDGTLKRNIVANGTILCFKNIISFRCSPHDTFYDLPYKNITVLQDRRVYNDIDNKHATHYVKKVMLSRYKDQPVECENTGLLYLTSNCRKLDPEYLRLCLDKYKFDKYIIATNQPERYQEAVEGISVTFPELPISNIFSKFNTYIYTPTDAVLNPHCGCFDCSPRFIVECEYYNKSVIYHDIDDTYLSMDTGLKTRMDDISQKFDTLALRSDDNITSLVRNIINEST